MTKSRKLILYGREACHLCEEMIASLRAMQKEVQFELEVVNIDSDSDLVNQYGERVPVLVDATDKKELCHYFLDQAAIGVYLSQI